MQLGLLAEGTKEEVFEILTRRAKVEKAKFKKLCDENYVNIGTTPDGRQLHQHAPIVDTTSAKLIDLTIEHAKEQLAHLSDTDECAVAFQITIHRLNPAQTKVDAPIAEFSKIEIKVDSINTQAPPQVVKVEEKKGWFGFTREKK